MKGMKGTKRFRLLLGTGAVMSILLGAADPAISGDDSERTRGILKDSGLVPSWRQFAATEAPDARGGYDIQPQPGGEQIKTKSPLAAFLLGGIVGFGSGQFYSQKRGSGYFFLGADLILSGVTIAGLAAFDEEKDEGFFGGIEELYAVYIALLGLAVSHGIQAVWGAYSAAEYNRSLSVIHTETPIPLKPGKGAALALRFSWRF